MRSSEFALDLIAAEERQRERVAEADDDEVAFIPSEIVVLDDTNVTTDESFHLEEPGTSMPFPGPGMLVSAFVIADSTDFNVTVELDGQTVIADSFANIQSISAELPRIDAYTDGSDEVFSITEYEYQHEIDVVIEPQSQITFSRVRAEADLVRD